MTIFRRRQPNQEKSGKPIWYFRYNYWLNKALPVFPIPPGVTFTTWKPELDRQIYEIVETCLLQGGESYPYWQEHVISNLFLPVQSIQAIAGGQLVGVTITKSHHNFKDMAYGSFMAIIPDFRGRGLFPALMTERLKALKKAGYRGMIVDIQDTNTRTLRLYECFGFELVQKWRWTDD
jgi:ribosomal protein S18 acetylase RimI-like enzyme